MRRSSLVLLIGACRFGFGPDAGSDEMNPLAPGEPGALDASSTTSDGPRGFGMYQVTRQTSPYLAPVGAQLVPGFVDGADEETYDLQLPFAFELYGVAHDLVIASVNGFVTFGLPPLDVESWTNDCPIDGTAPDAAIYLFWDDMFSSAMTAPKGSITYAVEGAAPNRRFSIEWRDLDGWYASGQFFYGSGMRVTQKLVLHEDNTFELHYGPRTIDPGFKWDCGAERHRGCSATVGAEAPGSVAFDLVSCGSKDGAMAGFIPLDDGTLIRFEPR